MNDVFNPVLNNNSIFKIHQCKESFLYSVLAHLYRCNYDILRSAFVPDEIELLMTDTDSLIFRVNCDSFV